MIGRPPPPAAPKSDPPYDRLCHSKVAGQDTACRVVERAFPTLRSGRRRGARRTWPPAASPSAVPDRPGRSDAESAVPVRRRRSGARAATLQHAGIRVVAALPHVQPAPARSGSSLVAQCPPVQRTGHDGTQRRRRVVWLTVLACACRKPCPRHATRRYSLIRPPMRACLRTWYCSRSISSGSGFSGAAAFRER